jgi:hypothetical protein
MTRATMNSPARDPYAPRRLRAPRTSALWIRRLEAQIAFRLLEIRIERVRLRVRALQQERVTTMTTAAEIAKLTEHAGRIKDLMRQSSAAGERAKTVFDRYEQTLANFAANVERVSKEDAALAAALAEMGNAGAALEEVFQANGDAAPTGDSKSGG